MDILAAIDNSKKLIAQNAPELLTGIGAAGVAVTAYLTAKATFRAAKTISDEAYEDGAHYGSKKEELTVKIKLVWKHYIPPVIVGTGTVVCVLAASREHNKRTAAVFTAFSLTEKAFAEYKDKVVEQIGPNKEEKVRAAVAEEELGRNPQPSVVVWGNGDVTCYDYLSGRYFMSDMETIRRAENEVNRLALHQRYVTVDDFYDLIDLHHTDLSHGLGWNMDSLLEIEYLSILAPNGKPCLAIRLNNIKPL